MCYKIKLLFIVALLSIVFVGCESEKEHATSFGTDRYYDDFLWKKWIPDTLTKTFVFNFNDDAINHMSEPLVIGVFKKNEAGKYVPVLKNEMKLFVNKQETDDNTIKVLPPVEKIDVSVVFNKAADNKVHHWHIRVVKDGGLERINGADPSQFGKEDHSFMKVTAKKKKIWNPLEKGMTFGGILLVALLALWFFVLKTMLYPTISIKNIQLKNDKDDFSRNIKARGNYKVILTSNTKAKQGFFERCFVGKIKYDIDERWTSDIVFERRNKKSLRVKTGDDFEIDSNYLELGNEYTLEHDKTRSKITVTIN